jgi:mannose/fructose/N-acetylgalactosamine-specific phosphotransferase system component IIC
VPGVVLLVLAAVLIAASLSIVRALSVAVSTGDALQSRPDRFPSILLQSAPTPMAVAGCVAAVVGIALLLAAPPQRHEADDGDG